MREGARRLTGERSAAGRRVLRWDLNANGGVVRCVGVDFLNLDCRNKQSGGWNSS